MTTPTRPPQAPAIKPGPLGYIRHTNPPVLAITDEVRSRFAAEEVAGAPARKPPSQRKVRITDRDRGLLALIGRLGCADIRHIQAITVTPTRAAAYRVTQRLARAGYLVRRRVSDAAADRSVWTITSKSAALLRRGPDGLRVTPYAPASSAQVKHRLRVLDVWLRYRTHPAYARARWWCDRDLASAVHPRHRRTPQASTPHGRAGGAPSHIPPAAVSALLPTGTPHLPDLVFVLDDGRAVAVEVELSAKPVRIYERLLVAYGASRFAGLHYWTATPTIATRLTTAARRVGVPAGYLTVSALV